MRRNVSARALFAAGLATIPAYVLQSEFSVRFAQVVLFAVLTRVAGKRLQWTYFVSLTAAITFFHLLVPTGAVIAELGPWPITSGALRSGLFKSLTILGLVFISLTTVRADLKLPGSIGAIFGRTFYGFERIVDQRATIRRGAIVDRVDSILLQLRGELSGLSVASGDVGSRNAGAQSSTVRGLVVVWAIVAIQWLALAADSVQPIAG